LAQPPRISSGFSAESQLVFKGTRLRLTQTLRALPAAWAMVFRHVDQRWHQRQGKNDNLKAMLSRDRRNHF